LETAGKFLGLLTGFTVLRNLPPGDSQEKHPKDTIFTQAHVLLEE
jgi:hypothetical protein